MSRIIMAGMETLKAALILIPIVLIMERVAFHEKRRTVGRILFTLYLSAVYLLAGLPDITYIRPELNLQLIPFLGMIDDWKNSILNVLLFVPMGVFLPLFWETYRSVKPTVLFGFFVSFGIEMLQTLTFRATDVNDLITNTLGTAAGCLLSRMIMGKSFSKPALSQKHAEPWVFAGVTFAVMFLIQPLLG